MRIDLPITRNQSYYVRRWGAKCPFCKKREKAGIGLTAEASAIEEEIAWLALSEYGRLDPKAAYEIHVIVHLNKNSRDGDSVIPLVPNAVCKGVGINDNRIFKYVIEKVIDGERFLEVWLKSDS